MKKTFKRLTAILMAMVMVFAMSSSVFAAGEKTQDKIHVNVTIDTRTLSRSDVMMKTSAGAPLGTNPVVKTTVEVEDGASVFDVLNAVKVKLGFDVISEVSSYGGTFVTDIAGVGEKTFVGDKVWNNTETKYDYLFNYTDTNGVKRNSLFSSEQEAGNYLLFAYGALCSGWVYNVNGYYPDKAMDLYTNVTDNCDVAFRYTVTGSYDVGSESFPSAPPYSNLDCDFLDLYDNLTAIANPTSDQQELIDQIEFDMSSCEKTFGGKTWISPFYLVSPLTGGYSDMIQGVL